jgi:ubiquinone/menaquinone biosynthesis C-methylase UbiE
VSGADSQRTAAQARYRDGSWEATWKLKYHDPLYRFLRHRRLRLALKILNDHRALDPGRQAALVVCGGVGEEGLLLRQLGFSHVTVSDISDDGLEICRANNPDLKTVVVNAEDMREFADRSYDIVVVQDGLHHLQRPVQGFTEMLRVARKAVVVIEPHHSAVGTLLGTTWERDGEAVNYVFRWNRHIFEQATYSFMQRDDVVVICRRLWDHPLAMTRAVDNLPGRARLPTARLLYGLLAPIHRAGNMMVGVVLKSSPADGPQRTLST